MIKTVNKNGLSFSYREGTPDKFLLRGNVFLGDESVDPFYKINKDNTIVMIGAHIGVFALYASRMVKKGKVYAIEPNNDNYALLVRNIEQNKLKNVYYDNIAVGGGNDKIKLFLDQNSVGHTTTMEISKEYELVDQCTLDKYFTDRKISHCDLLKINCEGAEYEIIDSISKECFEKIKNLIVSYHNDKVQGKNEKIIIRRLKENGYKVFRVLKGENRGWVIAYSKPAMKKILFYYRNRFLDYKKRIIIKILIILRIKRRKN